MFDILAPGRYQGFIGSFPSNRFPEASEQHAFIGRVQWNSSPSVDTSFIKLYRADTVGVANEAIGYVLNKIRRVSQPREGAVLFMEPEQFPLSLGNPSAYIHPDIGLGLAWVTPFEQLAKPFRTIRRLPGFTERQAAAFYASEFCRALASVDTVTGNNDRHEGNFLYVDDLNYLAIDQGCVGGGVHWHQTFPDPDPSNEIVRSVEQILPAVRCKQWYSQAILEHERHHAAFRDGIHALETLLEGLLTPAQISDIASYMHERSAPVVFSRVCRRLC